MDPGPQVVSHGPVHDLHLQAASSLLRILTVPAQISPKNSQSHLRKNLEVRLWGAAFFQSRTASPVTPSQGNWHVRGSASP